MTSPLDRDCPTCGAAAARYCVPDVGVFWLPGMAHPSRISAVQAEAVPGLANGEMTPVEFAQYTIDKHEDEPGKPSVYLARAVLALHARERELCEGLRFALDRWSEREVEILGPKRQRIAELRKLAGSG